MESSPLHEKLTEFHPGFDHSTSDDGLVLRSVCLRCGLFIYSRFDGPLREIERNHKNECRETH